MIHHLKKGLLFSLVRLNGNIEGVVSLLDEGHQARVGAQSSGARGGCTVELGISGKHDFECVVAELRFGRQARVADEDLFMNAQCAARRLR